MEYEKGFCFAIISGYLRIGGLYFFGDFKLCPHCSQKICRTCEPGYMKVIVDMKEFSKTFAEEMRLCTLCDHALCPGSELLASLRCRECDYEKCNDCSKQVDKMGEEWCLCCGCERNKDGFVVEFHRSVGAEIRYQDGPENSKSSPWNKTRPCRA